MCKISRELDPKAIAIAREENFERIREHVEGLSYLLHYNTEESRKEVVRIVLRQVKELCDDKS